MINPGVWSPWRLNKRDFAVAQDDIVLRMKHFTLNHMNYIAGG